MTEDQLSICELNLARKIWRIMARARYDGERMWLSREKWAELEALQGEAALLRDKVYEQRRRTEAVTGKA